MLIILWIAGTLSLLAPPVIGWLSSREPVHLPLTPVDGVNVVYARQWMLLQQAREVIPPGETYTTAARDRKYDEMLLFMLSLGVVLDAYPVPSSYWQGDTGLGKLARYVIAFECVEIPGARLVRRFHDGCVWERVDGP